MKVTRWWRELAALLVGLSVALFAAEGIVRRFAPQDTRIQSPGMYQSDSVTG